TLSRSSTNLGLDLERVDYWLDKGAQMSERVNQLYKSAKAATPGS
ncbi:MAG: 30S ribosomal protein S16, partial [Gammaproteobacteria bacterium]|nr:30S ribosomal protein S16 [Gammaproteobacteria bacterium]